MQVANHAATEGYEITLVENESHENTVANEGHENTTSSYLNDLQQECVELVQLESQRTNSTAESFAPKKKGRGPTVLPHVHNRTMDERPVIILNSYGQPVGPTKKLVSEYSLFSGTLARNPEYLPLNYCDWPSVLDNAKDQVWEYVQRKYLISSEGKHWTLETLKEEWKGWKCTMKAKYYSPYATYDERWDKRPTQFLKPNLKSSCTIGMMRQLRQLATDMHTMGPTSFAFIREQLKQEDPNKEEPSKAKVYGYSRKRKPEKSYKTSFGAIAANI
ncbi:putative cuticle collagen 99, partial [Bienertia sinuspersici]